MSDFSKDLEAQVRTEIEKIVNRYGAEVYDRSGWLGEHQVKAVDELVKLALSMY